jgi:protein-S-isoprenylcysteine O-methyltransferase Ste14
MEMIAMTYLKENLYPTIYLVGWIVMWIIRFSHLRKSVTNPGEERKDRVKDQLLVLLLFLGTSILPLVSILSSWLKIFDFNNPPWLGPIGIGFLIAGLVVLHLGHRDLKENYSQDLEIKDGHQLITTGIYQYIRNPMYAAGFLMAFSQIGLLENWLSGFAGIISLTLFYILRLPEEEAMLLEHFSDQYQNYMKTTPRLFPVVGKKKQC